ncbi:hypothetical protein [Streptomyces sp. NBC_01455]|uniref:hypothetical protein n=1 Tax=Streptomyces sp. NBC_01455 TaxID=2903874 RepID=UPI002E340E80|nr:hypothetical protein [Streptomyces sp. NBC_01455]
MSSKEMPDTEVQSVPGSRHRGLNYSTVSALAVVLLAVGALGGWYVGRESSGHGEASRCTQARNAINDYVEQYKDTDPQSGTADEQAQARQDTRTALNVQVQNPDCFSPKERAQAQSWLDSMDQTAAREAQQPAPERTGCFWNASEC